MDKRKWISFLRLVAGALIIELIICNFSSWKSLFYQNRILFEDVTVEGGSPTGEDLGGHIGQYIVPDGTLTLHVTKADTMIHNLFFALDFSEPSPVSYTVTLTDEGNYYPYTLPEKMLMPGIKRSFYTNLYASGKTGTIDVQFSVPAGSFVTVNGICANARIPFLFSLGRFLLLLGFFLLFDYARHVERWQNTACEKTKKQYLITTVTILLLI